MRSIVLLIILFTANVFPVSGQQEGSHSLFTENFQELKSFYDIPVSIQVEKASLGEIFNELEKQMGLRFLYNRKVIGESEYRLDLNFTDVSVANVLTEVAIQTGLTFRQINGTISIGLDKFRAVETEILGIVQQTITGQVTDTETGENLPGVNVYVPDTDIGTSTNADGEYSLNIPDDADALIFSLVGYQQELVDIAGRSTIDMALEQAVIIGEEMVVTAFGIEREARGLTYSTQGVSTEQLTEARELNVMNSLQGKVAGLNITRSGAGVGASSRVVLRGNRSINGNNQPLYVLDGVPVRGGVDDISPDNIESVSVLKGPNAAALYGSAAQNGAIIVTTRRGMREGVQIGFSQTVMAEEPLIIDSRYQNEYGQGNDGVYSRGSEVNWGPRMDGQQVQHWSPDPARDGETYAFNPQPNNIRDVFRTGFNSTTNFNVSVGSGRSQAFFSYTFTQAEGMVPNNDMERHNISLRFNSQLSDQLRLDSRISYINRNVDNQVSQGTNRTNAMRYIYRLPRNIQTGHVADFEYFNSAGARFQNYWNPGSNGGANPYWTLNRNLSENASERFLGMASLTYNFSEMLSLMVRASYDGNNSRGETRLYNDTYVVAPRGSYSLNRGNSMEFNGDFLLAYEDNITDNWSLSTNFGGNIQSRRNSNMSTDTGGFGGGGLTQPNFFTLTNAAEIRGFQSFGSPREVQSLYGSGQIGWRDALYLDVTGRNDWSSTLPADSRSYFYPSVGLSAVLSDLIPAFPEFFTFTRLRASFAEVGNDAPVFSLTRTALLSPNGGLGFMGLSETKPAENLRPEQTRSFEAGADVRFFDGRLGLDFTWYQMNTKDQLFTVDLPAGSGAAETLTNAGDVENRGVEILLSTRPVQSIDFNWDLNLNFARNRNTVVEIHEQLDELIISSNNIRQFRIVEGDPYGEIYTRGYVRDDQGRVVIGSDGIPQITTGFDVAAANFSPDWTGGISSSFSFRNISASFLIDHRQGGTIASLTEGNLSGDGATSRTLEGREGGLVFGDNFFSGETAVLEDGSPNTIEINAEQFWRNIGSSFNPIGEAFIENATNTRLREVTIGYTLPGSAIAALPVSNIKVSLVGRNLFFIYRDSDIDPDIMAGTGNSAEGWEGFAPPTARTFGMNLKIDF